MELGGSLPHSQVSKTFPYPSQINPFFCPSHFWQAQIVSFLVGLRTYQHLDEMPIQGSWWVLSPTRKETSYITHILWNLMVHYRIHKSPRPFRTLAKSFHSSVHHTFDIRKLFPSWSVFLPHLFGVQHYIVFCGLSSFTVFFSTLLHKAAIFLIKIYLS